VLAIIVINSRPHHSIIDHTIETDKLRPISPPSTTVLAFLPLSRLASSEEARPDIHATLACHHYWPA
jgi:hypothetical protein